MRKITLLKSGNRLVVSPTSNRIRDLLTPYLTFQERVYLRGWERKLARQEHRPIFTTTDWECWGLDHRKRLSTYVGFYKRIYRRLKKRGYQVVMRDLLPPKKPQIFEPQWDLLQEFGIKLRPGQAEFLAAFLANRCGRFSCPPGFGKSFMIGVIAILLPKARIDVITKRVPVAYDRIYQSLRGMMLDVGMVGGKHRILDRRIMVCTAGSMQHLAGDADILIGDECHELVSDETARKFGRWDNSRNYGLSASHDLRLDGKDLRGEGMFGPIIYEMSYQEAQGHEMVVPIQVIWDKVDPGYDVCEETEDVAKKRLGYWTNDYRNDLIAKAAREYDDKTQTLITTETIEHAINLKKRLPEYVLVYAEDGLAEKDRRWYVNHQLLDYKEPRMTDKRKLRLTHGFETGKIKKAICTTCWNVGVDFRHLRVLIRADGGGSPINDVQIPGRVSRPNAPFGKFQGIVRDFLDEFNDGCHQRAMSRKRNYIKYGWDQKVPPKPVKAKKAKQKKKSEQDIPGQKKLWEDA